MNQPAIFSVREWPSKVRPHTITFVRHGEKNGSGFSADLTEKGCLDALGAGKRIAFKVDLFLCSPSPRTVSTARFIRNGNGSDAPVVQEEQLAEPGLGMYADYASAMRSFLGCILQIVRREKAEVIVATTHNYVVEYLSNLPGCIPSESGLLSGITFNLEVLSQMAETL